MARRKSEYVGLLIGHLKHMKNMGTLVATAIMDNELATKKLKTFAREEGIESAHDITLSTKSKWHC